MSESFKQRLAGARRKGVTPGKLVAEGTLAPGQRLPLVLEAAVQSVDLVAWAADHRELIARRIRDHGGLLFRGFQVGEVGDFERFIETVSDQALEYRERSSPRTKVAGNVYTSTDYPAEQEIFLHNENSYQARFPQKIFFYCVTPATTGGETPIADCRKIYERIDPEVRQRFADAGWMYIRNFGDGLGLPWWTVFQTEDKAEVADHCRRHGIELEWKPDNRLRTRAVRPAIARHPDTGELIWFNHATFFHNTTLAPEIREVLLAEFAEEDLPTNTCYGDGAPIEPQVLDHLRQLYREETVSFPWQRGDVLMLDNLRVAHGRSPYSGPRKVVVGMAQPRTWDEVAV